MPSAAMVITRIRLDEVAEILLQRKVEEYGVPVFNHDLAFICRQEPWYASRVDECVPLVTEVHRSAT